MRRALPMAIVPALLLAACNREPSFDERYGKAEKAIRAKAAGIDAELAEGERQANAAAAPSAQATALMKAAK